MPSTFQLLAGFEPALSGAKSLDEALKGLPHGKDNTKTVQNHYSSFQLNLSRFVGDIPKLARQCCGTLPHATFSAASLGPRTAWALKRAWGSVGPIGVYEGCVRDV